MSFGSQYNLNQRITYLEYLFNNLPPFPTTPTLEEVLTEGNDADNQSIIGLSQVQIVSPSALTETTTISNTEMLIQDTAGVDPTFTKINKNEIVVNGGGVSELDTRIQPQSTIIRLNNDCYTSITPSYFSALNTQGVGYTATLYAEYLRFNNNNTAGEYTIGSNSNDLVINAGGDRLLLNANDNEFYIGEYTTGTAPCINSTGSLTKTIFINTRDGQTQIGDADYSFNGTRIIVDDSLTSINNFCQEFKLTGLGTGNSMNFNDGANAWNATLGGGSNITFNQNDGRFRVGDVSAVGNGMLIDLDYQSGFSVYTGDGTGQFQRYYINQTGFQTWQGGMSFDNVNNTLAFGKPKYASNYFTTSQTLNGSSSYSNTFNGSSLTATLHSVTLSNVGIQFLITNTNASAMTVVSTGGQIIYSSTTGGATSRTLAVGHSQIFTAIKTTGNTTYGWSMV